MARELTSHTGRSFQRLYDCRKPVKQYYIYFHDGLLGGPCCLKISSYPPAAPIAQAMRAGRIARDYRPNLFQPHSSPLPVQNLLEALSRPWRDIKHWFRRNSIKQYNKTGYFIRTDPPAAPLRKQCGQGPPSITPNRWGLISLSSICIAICGLVSDVTIAFSTALCADPPAIALLGSRNMILASAIPHGCIQCNETGLGGQVSMWLLSPTGNMSISLSRSSILQVTLSPPPTSDLPAKAIL